jgi:hypothetical protein
MSAIISLLAFIGFLWDGNPVLALIFGTVVYAMAAVYICSACDLCVAIGQEISRRLCEYLASEDGPEVWRGGL